MNSHLVALIQKILKTLFTDELTQFRRIQEKQKIILADAQ